MNAKSLDKIDCLTWCVFFFSIPYKLDFVLFTGSLYKPAVVGSVWACPMFLHVNNLDGRVGKGKR